jgi:vancomycin resistance protein YoaR
MLPASAVAQSTQTKAPTPATQSKAPAPAPAAAPAKATNTDLQILLDKVKADKKVLVAANMEMTEADKAKFWPIYDAYQKDLAGINDRMAKAIRTYAEAYVARSITDEQARKLTDEVVAIEADEAKLRANYSAKLFGAVPAKVAARYLQIESKIRAALRYEMANGIPLVP